MGLREDGRGLKQISHEKLFKKLFLGDLQLGESRDESRKLLDEFATGFSRLVSCELSREKFRDWRVSREKL